MSETTEGHQPGADVVTVLASTPLPLVLTTVEARIIFANRAAQRLLGIGAADVTGRFLAEFAGPPHGRVRRLAAVASGASHPVTSLLTLVASRRRRVGVRVVVGRGQAADGDPFLTWQVTTAPMAHALPEAGPEPGGQDGPFPAETDGQDLAPAGPADPPSEFAGPLPAGEPLRDPWWSLAVELVAPLADEPVAAMAERMTGMVAAALGHPVRLQYVSRSQTAPVAAASDPLAALAAQVEAETGAVPAAGPAGARVVADVADEAQGLGAVGRALADRLGVRSLVAAEFSPADGCRGVLAGYAEQPGTFTDDHCHRLVGLGRLLGAAMESAIRQQAAAAEVGQLRTAMTSRAVIEQAKGMLMAAGKVDADTAFGELKARSQGVNRRLRDVAADLVDARSRQAGPAAAGSCGAPTVVPDATVVLPGESAADPAT